MSAVVTSIEYVYLIPAEILTIQTLKEKKKKKKKRISGFAHNASFSSEG